MMQPSAGEVSPLLVVSLFIYISVTIVCYLLVRKTKRLSRGRFFAYTMLLILIWLMILLLLNPFSEWGYSDNQPVLPVMYFVAIYLTHVFLIIRRLHDLGKSVVYGFFLLIPIVYIFILLWLMLAPGNVGINKYGDDPLVTDASKLRTT